MNPPPVKFQPDKVKNPSIPLLCDRIFYPAWQWDAPTETCQVAISVKRSLPPVQECVRTSTRAATAGCHEELEK